MSFVFSPRPWFFIAAASCASLLGFGLYLQHAEFLDPCPLCIFQRLAFMWIGLVALIAAIHNPGVAGRWFYAILLGFGGLAGTVIAARHVWLQQLPPDQVPECGMGLNYMLENMPVADVVRQVFEGSGECATIDWTFLGLSMPTWTLFWYIGLTLVTIGVTISANRRARIENGMQKFT